MQQCTIQANLLRKQPEVTFTNMSPGKRYLFPAIGGGIAVAIIIGLFAYYSLSPASSVQQGKPNNVNQTQASVGVQAFAPDSKPYGKSLSDWSVAWWIWAQNRPVPVNGSVSENPVADTTGEKCHADQTDPNVFFLAGTLGGKAERNCEIPANKALFFPLINSECSWAENPTYTKEQQLRECAIAGAKGAVLEAIVDGVPIPNLQQYWVESPLYNVTLPAPNFWGVNAGNTQQVSTGYWLMLQPLPSGKHDIRFAGVQTATPGSGPTIFANDAIYHLTIK